KYNNNAEDSENDERLAQPSTVLERCCALVLCEPAVLAKLMQL
ncbi:1419_t:CDS:1, partial [Paraglomus brasilianum]